MSGTAPSRQRRPATPKADAPRPTGRRRPSPQPSEGLTRPSAPWQSVPPSFLTRRSWYPRFDEVEPSKAAHRLKRPRRGSTRAPPRRSGCCIEPAQRTAPSPQDMATVAGLAFAPALRLGDVVVTDDLSAHKLAGVRAAIEATGASALHLPPYSPDLNPIEQAFRQTQDLAPQSRRAKARRPPGRDRQSIRRMSARRISALPRQGGPCSNLKRKRPSRRRVLNWYPERQKTPVCQTIEAPDFRRVKKHLNQDTGSGGLIDDRNRQAQGSIAATNLQPTDLALKHRQTVAERVGFEPTVRLPAQRFSRPSQSTTLAPLRTRQSRRYAVTYTGKRVPHKSLKSRDRARS